MSKDNDECLMDSADKYDNSLSLVVRLPTYVILSFRISILFARTLTRFSHLKGHFGTAWQNQQKEFDHLPAPILYTTNCLMPPKNSYADRVFTTEVVAFPGAVHIDEKKDFTPVIEKALELGGYKEDQLLTGINGGTKVTTGFGSIPKFPDKRNCIAFLMF